MKRAQKKIYNPLFLKCMDYTLDQFWKQIFTDIAYGKYPKGCGISDNILYVKTRSNTQTLVLSSDPKQLFIDVTKILKEKLGLSSTIDKQKIMEDHKKAKEELEKLYYSTWSSIKKKSIRDELIIKFVISEKEKNKLGLHKTKRLLSLIHIGFMLKDITSKDIIMEDGRIRKISGLSYNQKLKDYVLTKKHKPETKKESDPEEEDKVDLMVVWKKYIASNVRRNKALVNN